MNGRVESFFDKLRDELLNRAAFTCGEEVQTALDEHMDYYNHLRPHRNFAEVEADILDWSWNGSQSAERKHKKAVVVVACKQKRVMISYRVLKSGKTFDAKLCS